MDDTEEIETEGPEAPEPTGPNEAEETPDPKASRDYWQRWIRTAKKAAARHWKDTKEAWREFEFDLPTTNDSEMNRDGEDTASYPLYWSSVKTIMPAYYSRTPEPVTNREFEIDDPVALTATLINQRVAKYLLRSSNFDEAMIGSLGDFIHGDKATTQICYEAKVEDSRIDLVIQADPQTGQQFYVDAATGQPYQGQEPVMEDEKGQFVTLTGVTKKKILLKRAHYDQVLHTPEASCTSEVRDMAYWFSMSEDEAEDRFGEEKCKRIQWKEKKAQGNDDETNDPAVSPGKVVEGWEIFCKESRRVYWYSDQYMDGLLDEKDDPYGFADFFPSPKFIIGSRPSNSLYPTPAYIHCRDVLRALHRQSFRVYNLLDAIRRRALVDASNPDLIAALRDAGDNEFIACKNLQSLVEKGGIANAVLYLDVQEFVSAIGELKSIEEDFKNQFFEWFGVPDILRGVSDPVETAAAQEIKQASAHDRFKYDKKQVKELARDSIELMLDLFYQVMDDQEIQTIAGYEYMGEEDQQRFIPALALLKNDKIRLVRIDFETDSLSFIDQQLKQQRVNSAVGIVTQGLQSVAQMAQGDPTFLPVALQTVLMSLEAADAGKDFTERVSKAIKGLIESKQNPPEMPPPPPDYEMMKIQMAGQKQQLEGQKMMLEAQAKQRELDQQEAKIAIEGAKTTAESEVAQGKLQIEAMVQTFAMKLEEQRLILEKFQAEMQAKESAMEEIRLGREADMAVVKQAQELVTANKPGVPEVGAKALTINIDAKGQPLR